MEMLQAALNAGAMPGCAAGKAAALCSDGRGATPPPADAAAGGSAAAGSAALSRPADDASPDASSTPLCWPLAQAVSDGSAPCAAAMAVAPASAACAPLLAAAVAAAAAAAAAGQQQHRQQQHKQQHAIVRAPAKRTRNGRGAAELSPWQLVLPAKQPALAPPQAGQPQRPARLELLAAAADSTPDDSAAQQCPCDDGSNRSGSGSGTNSCCSSAGLALLAGVGSGGSVTSGSGAGIDALAALLRAQQRQQWLVQQQQLQQQQLQQQLQQQQLNLQALAAGRRRLSALRSGGPAAPAPAMSASPPPPLYIPADAALAWAAAALGVTAREVLLFARHVWARAAGRVDACLVASLGAAQPPERVAALAALWLASKLEGGRRAVAGASRLCAATGLTRWGVTSVEVHVLQLLDFRPYRGW